VEAAEHAPEAEQPGVAPLRPLDGVRQGVGRLDHEAPRRAENLDAVGVDSGAQGQRHLDGYAGGQFQVEERRVGVRKARALQAGHAHHGCVEEMGHEVQMVRAEVAQGTATRGPR
jgi:hypothetical protein